MARADVDNASSLFRIVIVASDTYPPQRVDVTVLFGEELAKRGHRIDWILQSEQSCTKSYATQWANGTVYVGPTDQGTSLVSRIRKHIVGIAHDLLVLRLVRDGSYDIVGTKDKFVSGLFALLAARRYGKRFVYWLSYPFPEAYLFGARDGTARYPLLSLVRGYAFSFLLYRILLPCADHVFVQSKQMKKDVVSKGISETKVTPVPMGVKVSAIQTELNEELRQPSSHHEPSFLYLGVISRVRRIDFLLHVLANVRLSIPTAVLYLVGGEEDAAYKRTLIDEATKLGVAEAVIFTGQLPRKQAFRYVAGADVCVSPIFPNPVLNPASPTKLVEYLALGKAVVANDHPDQRDVLNDSGAGICVPWDEQAFARAIVELLSSPELAQTMGSRGRRWVRDNRDYPILADLVEETLLTLVQPVVTRTDR
jgi:glycosyltransferase involved in cell wall biosynthesis